MVREAKSRVLESVIGVRVSEKVNSFFKSFVIAQRKARFH